jgi:hypothetical protein
MNKIKSISSIGIILIAAILLAGCTQNQRARGLGGSATIEAPAGKTVVNMTWKETQLWVQYRDRAPGEKPQTTVFKEYSSFGILEGQVTVIEK